jgi:protein-S-isoprenylcysteine O-methyltransferase Ste14
MKLKIPPVVQFLLAAIAMWVIDWQLPQFAFSLAGQHIISSAVFLSGLIIVAIAIAGFRRADTTANPMDPSKANALVVNGLYKVTRNPMYLGMLLGLIGIAVWFGNPLNIGVLVFFVWYMTEFQIKPEEDSLREKFGGEYDAYCKKVRRWI